MSEIQVSTDRHTHTDTHTDEELELPVQKRTLDVHMFKISLLVINWRYVKQLYNVPIQSPGKAGP